MVMKKLLIFSLRSICAGGLFLFSCTNRSDQKPADGTAGDPPARDTSATAANANDLNGCFLRVLQRDTLVAHLQQNGNAITGKLTFDNFEKDGSTGTVKGTLEGDILKLIYTFRSEGMNSVMEVYFKKQDDKLIRGTGEINVKGDTAYFTQPRNISYEGDDVLRKVACAELDEKYR